MFQPLQISHHVNKTSSELSLIPLHWLTAHIYDQRWAECRENCNDFISKRILGSIYFWSSTFTQYTTFYFIPSFSISLPALLTVHYSLNYQLMNEWISSFQQVQFRFQYIPGSFGANLSFQIFHFYSHESKATHFCLFQLIQLSFQYFQRSFYWSEVMFSCKK